MSSKLATPEKPPIPAAAGNREELKSYLLFFLAFAFHFLVCEAAKRAESKLHPARQIYPQLLSDKSDFFNTLKCGFRDRSPGAEPPHWSPHRDTIRRILIVCAARPAG